MSISFKKQKIELRSHDLTIFYDDNEATTYDPKKKEEISHLCRIANIEEFISESDKKNYPALLIFENKRYNRGVITKEPIKKYKTICQYLGEIGSIDKATHRSRVKKILQNTILEKPVSQETINGLINSYIKHVTDYAFEITEEPNEKDTVMAHNKRSLAAFINHNSTDPNVKAYVKNNTIYYKAARDINKDEQLTIDYGTDYDYQDKLYYIPSTENHLVPAKFLADNIKYYHKKPIKLTQKQKMILQTISDTVMIPTFLHKLLYTKKINRLTSEKLSEYEKRLPVIEVFLNINASKKTKYAIHVSHEQQNITPLIFASALLNTEVVILLTRKYKVDIFAKTLLDLDALIIALKSSDSEDQFIRLAKPLIKKCGTFIDRAGVIGSDNHVKTALHLLVDLEWCEAIALFDNISFFDLIDTADYDPLLASIAYGKPRALTALLKLKCVRKYMYELLFSKEENRKGLVIERVLQEIPSHSYEEIINILMKVGNRRPQLKKKLSKIINLVSPR